MQCASNSFFKKNEGYLILADIEKQPTVLAVHLDPNLLICCRFPIEELACFLDTKIPIHSSVDLFTLFCPTTGRMRKNIKEQFSGIFYLRLLDCVSMNQTEVKSHAS